MEFHVQKTEGMGQQVQRNRGITQCLRQAITRSSVLVGGDNGEPGSTEMQNGSEFHIMKLGVYPRDVRETRDDFRLE